MFSFNNNFLFNEIFGTEFFVYDSLPSTNTEAIRLAKLGCQEGSVIIAREQTGGRGRMGKSFFSPRDSGIYMSIILKPLLAAEKSQLITVLASVCAARAIEQASKSKAMIKWVNDIYINKKKVSGILTEAAFSSSQNTPDYVVMGIGINVSTKHFPRDISKASGSVFEGYGNTKENLKFKFLSESGLPYLNRTLMYSFLKELKKEYAAINDAGFLEEYKSRCFTIGQNVKFERNGGILFAKAVDIDTNAGLIVEYENKERETLNSGEISIIKDKDL